MPYRYKDRHEPNQFNHCFELDLLLDKNYKLNKCKVLPREMNTEFKFKSLYTTQQGMATCILNVILVRI